MEKSEAKYRQAEERIKHLNAVLRAIRNVNQLIIREKDRDKLLQGICDTLIATPGYYNAWIALIDESGELVMTAEAGLGENFLPMAELLKRRELPYCGRMAMKQSGVVTIEDPPSTCADCPLAGMYGGRGAMAVRLEHGGKVYGLLTASIPRDYLTDEQERSLFEEVAEDIAFALRGIELEEEHKRAQEALRQSQQRYRSLVESATNVLFAVSTDGTITSLNPAFERITGWSRAEWLGKPFAHIIHPDDLPFAKELFQRALQGEVLPAYELRILLKSGESLVWEFTLIPQIQSGKVVGLLGSVRDITERKRFEERLSAIHALGQKLVLSRDVEEIAQSVVDAAQQVLHIPLCGLWLVDEEQKTLVRLAHTAGPQAPDAPPFPLDSERGITVAVVRSGEPINLPDVGRDSRYVDIGFQARSELCVPLRVGGKVIGVLNAESQEPEAFDEADQQLLSTLADQAALAIQNARLFSDLSRRLQELTRLQEVSAAVVGELDLERLLDLVVKTTAVLMDAEGAGINLLDPNGQTHTYVASYGIAKALHGLQLPAHVGLPGWVIQEGRPVLVNDALADERVDVDLARKYGVKRVVIAPLKIKGQVIGCISAFNRRDNRYFTEYHLQLLTIFANQAAVAIEKARLFEKVKRSEQRYRIILESSADAIVSLDPDLKISAWSKGAEQIFGYTKEEIIGKPHSILIPEHARRQTAQVLKEVRKRGFVRGRETQRRAKDGRLVDVEVTLTNLGPGLGFTAILRDVTDRKQAEKELKRSFEKLQRTMEGTVNTLASIIEMRDPYTAGHQRRVVQLACAVAKEMGLTQEQIDGLHMAAHIHDIGKVSVPTEILSKPGQLTKLEFDMVKAHPKVAYEILKGIDFPWPIAQIVLQHHERMDGSGYPQGLKGEEILLEARVLAVADVVEAMSSHRPYRPALGIEKALEEISKNKGVLYDPEVVDACLRLFTEKGFKFEEET